MMVWAFCATGADSVSFSLPTLTCTAPWGSGDGLAVDRMTAVRSSMVMGVSSSILARSIEPIDFSFENRPAIRSFMVRAGAAAGAGVATGAGASTDTDAAAGAVSSARAGPARATAPKLVAPMIAAVAAKRRSGFMRVMSSSLLDCPGPGGPGDGDDDEGAPARLPRGNRKGTARPADPPEGSGRGQDSAFAA